MRCFPAPIWKSPRRGSVKHRGVSPESSCSEVSGKKCRSDFPHPLIYSYYCLLYALLLSSASLARKFRAAALLAFSALRVLSFEVLRVRERASTHPTHCLRTFRSTVRPTCKKESEVCTNTYVRGRDKRSLNATPSTKSKKVSVYETGLARPCDLVLSTCCRPSRPRPLPLPAEPAPTAFDRCPAPRISFLFHFNKRRSTPNPKLPVPRVFSYVMQPTLLLTCNTRAHM